MGQTKDFFKEKKAWSALKDEILDYYLTPYISKIQWASRPLYIFDCFAGKGKFDDGTPGSPLIIASHIRETIQRNPRASSKIQGAFIEKKYGAHLEINMVGCPNTKVLHGTFEDNLNEILSLNKNSSVFLYIDPYGIKSLNFENFNRLAEKHFSSVELLMNFNSTGFLREGCRLLKYAEPQGDDELTDYESDDDIKTIDRLNAIAGGEYWQDILKNYYDKVFGFSEAEDAFVAAYSQALRNIFRYTVNIPIKVKSTHLPKYRLIFGSNHKDGLILMADNMNKKWKKMLASQAGGQLVLFDFEFQVIADSELRDSILQFVAKGAFAIRLQDLYVDLILKYGIVFSESEYSKKIKQMEKETILVIERDPPLTRKTGKPATSMDYNEYNITVRRR